MPLAKRVKLDSFIDHRGEYCEIYNSGWILKLGHKVPFIQDDISISRKGVLRGIHGDRRTWKYVSVLYGAAYVVVVDPQSKKWESYTIDEKSRVALLSRPGLGLGHLALTDPVVWWYKQSADYGGPQQQFTIRYDDPAYDIYWPTKDPILSRRDSGETDLSIIMPFEETK